MGATRGVVGFAERDHATTGTEHSTRRVGWHSVEQVWYVSVSPAVANGSRPTTG